MSRFKLSFFKSGIILIFILLQGSVYSQDDTFNIHTNYPAVIDSIEIEGNSVTEPYIILREVTFSINDTITRKVADYNRERIYSLGIFTHVDLFLKEAGDITILLIKIEESWYIWPIPFADLKEGDWNKLSYGFDVLIKNFRGRNENLGFRFALGYDPEFLVYYQVPYVWEEGKISIEFSSYYGTIMNKSRIAKSIYGKDFEQTHINNYVGFGRRFDLYNRLLLYFGFLYVETPEYFPGISASGQRIDKSGFIGLKYTFDSRDLAQFPLNGRFFSVDYQLKGVAKEDISYNVISADYKEYREIYSDFSAKWRLATRHTFGVAIPYYEHSFIGYGEKVRGHHNDRREGNSTIMTSLELRYPVIKEWNLSFDLPIIPKELLTYRIGFYPHIFIDAGATHFRNQTLGIDDFKFGFGVGFTVLVLPYNIGRMEVAFNEKFDSEIIFALGISF